MDKTDFVGCCPTNVERPKTCSLNYMNIHKKTPVPKFNFNKVANLQSENTKTHRYKCFPGNFTKFFRTTFLNSTCE